MMLRHKLAFLKAWQQRQNQLSIALSPAEVLRFHGYERRKDLGTSDIVEIGLLFMVVFGHDKGLNFFRSTVIEPRIYLRIMSGRYRAMTPREVEEKLR